MIWVAWRQHRQQAMAGAGLLALLGAFVLVTGLQMSHSFHSTGLADCIKISQNPSCFDLSDAFMRRFGSEQVFAILFVVLPVLAGMFWGAPLVARELERGTQRLAWTQSISRRRWLSWKVGFVGAVTALAGAVFALLVSWWMSPLLKVTSYRDNSGAAGFRPGLFDLHGVVPIGYALFALALGLALGHVIGKVLPAMGATLAGFIGVRVIVELFARPHYIAPKIANLRFLGPDAHGWTIKAYSIDASGRRFAANGISPSDITYFRAHCPGFPMGPGVVGPKADVAAKLADACYTRVGLHTIEAYQPASRYWTFQWIEFAIFVGLAIALVGFVVWRINRTAS